MPVLFLSRPCRLFLTGNDQLILIKTDLDIFLVHTRKFGGYFERISCFRHTDCWCARSDVRRRRTLIESAKHVFHFAPHGSERVEFLAAHHPQSWKAHLFSPSLRKIFLNMLLPPGPDDLDPAQMLGCFRPKICPKNWVPWPGR